MAHELKQETREILEAAHEWMVALEDPNVSVAERRRFEVWQAQSPLHADVYDRVITYREAIKTLPNDAFDDDLHELSFRERIHRVLETIWSTFSHTRTKLALTSTAVVAIVVLMIFPALKHEPAVEVDVPPVVNSHSSSIGEVVRVSLSDASVVTLGAYTEIRVAFDDNRRQIELVRGEAFFEVSPDPERPFAVSVGRLTATALGTAFDVRSSGDISRITVAEGQVEVSHPFIIGGQSTSITSRENLSSGQSISATTAAGLGDRVTIDRASVAAWREGRLLYRGASLAEVISDANRYSAVPIEVEPDLAGVDGRQIRGVFLGHEVENLLLSVAEVLPVTVDRTDPSRIVLRSRN